VSEDRKRRRGETFQAKKKKSNSSKKEESGLSDYGAPSGARHLFLFHRIQTGSGAHPTSCPRVPGDLSKGSKAARNVKLSTHHHLVPKLRMVELYLHIPT
jgi:hypothetical protein